MIVKLLLCITILSLFACVNNEENSVRNIKTEAINQKTKKVKKYALDTARLALKAKEALAFSKIKELNTHYCILIDMKIHSGRKRLFLWDFKKNKIVLSGLSSHGCGNLNWGSDSSKDNPTFSNVADSHLSSIGKYKLGKRGWSNWGVHINYKLHGLEQTNNKAYKRVIVLHSWEAVEEREVYPKGTPEGWGCPAINNNVMKKLDQYLKKEKTPLLLWMYQ
jgi:hypothetical protein